MKFKDLQKISKDEKEEKLKELKIELIKSKTGASKQGGSKHKQVKKIIARIHTLNNREKLLGGNKQ